MSPGCAGRQRNPSRDAPCANPRRPGSQTNLRPVRLRTNPNSAAVPAKMTAWLAPNEPEPQRSTAPRGPATPRLWLWRSPDHVLRHRRAHRAGPESRRSNGHPPHARSRWQTWQASASRAALLGPCKGSTPGPHRPAHVGSRPKSRQPKDAACRQVGLRSGLGVAACGGRGYDPGRAGLTRTCIREAD
jgi:hypothetical protein